MQFKAFASLICFIALAFPAGAQRESHQPGLLRLPIFPIPLVRQAVPLTKALSEVGVFVRNGYVLFGVELWLQNEQEPTVNLNLEPGSTLGLALQQIFDQVPEYRFDVVSEHMINVYPTVTKNDPSDILNLVVARFDAVNVQPSGVLSRPSDFIPELRARLSQKQPRSSGDLGPGIQDNGPTVTLHMKNVTVRRILNAVSEATEEFPANLAPLGWSYSFHQDKKSPVGGTHSWKFVWSVPRDWKEEAEKGRNP